MEIAGRRVVLMETTLVFLHGEMAWRLKSEAVASHLFSRGKGEE